MTVISACTRSLDYRLGGNFLSQPDRIAVKWFFESADCTLRWIRMVIVGISKLILEIIGGDVPTHAVGDLIVEFVNDRIDTSGLKFCVASIVALDKVFYLSTLDGVDKDGIGVMIVK